MSTDQNHAAACDRCLARPWLLARLAGHLDRLRGRIQELLVLSDGELIKAAAGKDGPAVSDELARFEPGRARRRAAAAQLELICRCNGSYPLRLRDLSSAPAVLHVAGGMQRFLDCCERDPVAVVGSRRASGYGLEVGRSLGRGLASARVTVLSGMAIGIDSAAHAGALGGGGATIAVLPGSADRPYPAGRRALYGAILADGVAISELGPGSEIRRWAFLARNRLIAALAAMTVVVEAGEGSGALVTASIARALDRSLGAVPGRVTSAQAAGPNRLLAQGARVVRGAQDVVDALYGSGARPLLVDSRGPLAGEARAVVAAVADGQDTAAALVGAGLTPERVMAALASLELSGHVRRQGGGRYSVIP